MAKWNGTSWSSLGTGVDNDVYAISSGLSRVYIAGSFSCAGGIPTPYTNNIASWDGSHWAYLRGGLNGIVNALATSGDTLYAGGYFTTGTAKPGDHIAMWDGSNWNGLGEGLNGYVYALSKTDGNVFAGGPFTSAGLVAANEIAVWNIPSKTWSALGSGITGSFGNVLAISNSGQDIYVGGSFALAGGKPSYSFARYSPMLTGVEIKPQERPGTFVLSQNYPNPFNPSTIISYQLPAYSFVTLKIYDIIGREVATLVNEKEEAGGHKVIFDGSRFASGVYFCRLQTGAFIAIKKLVLIK